MDGMLNGVGVFFFFFLSAWPGFHDDIYIAF